MIVKDLEKIVEDRDLTREEVLSLWEEGDEGTIKWLQWYRGGVIGLNWYIEFCDEWAFDVIRKGEKGWIHPTTYIFKNGFGKQLYYLKFSGEDAEELRREEEARKVDNGEVQVKKELRKVKVKALVRAGEIFGEAYVRYYTQDPIYDLFRLLGRSNSKKLSTLVDILEASEFHFGKDWAVEKEKELAELLDLEQVEIELEEIGHTNKMEEGWHELLPDRPLFLYKDVNKEFLEIYIDDLEKEFHSKMKKLYKS